MQEEANNNNTVDMASSPVPMTPTMQANQMIQFRKRPLESVSIAKHLK
jgi:hypothetical protein